MGLGLLVIALDLMVQRKGWLALLSAVGLLVPLALTITLWVDPKDVLADNPTGLFNTLLVDKYASGIGRRRWRGGAAVFLEREARRLWFALAAIALVPLRHSAGDEAAAWGATAIAAAIILPDVCRMVAAGIRAVIDGTQVTPATYVMLPKR